MLPMESILDFLRKIQNQMVPKENFEDIARTAFGDGSIFYNLEKLILMTLWLFLMLHGMD